MNSLNFYSTVDTYDNNQVEITGVVPSPVSYFYPYVIQDYTGNDAYLIGYCEGVSDCYASEIELIPSAVNPQIKIDCPTLGDRVNFTWGGEHTTSPKSIGEQRFQHSKTALDQGIGFPYALFNKLNVGNLTCEYPLVRVGIHAYIYDSNDTYVGDYMSTLDQVGGGTDPTYAETFMNYYKGETTRAVSYTVQGTTINFSYSLNDFDDGAIEVEEALQNGNTLKGYIYMQFQINPARDISVPFDDTSSPGDYSNAVPTTESGDYILRNCNHSFAMTLNWENAGSPQYLDAFNISSTSIGGGYDGISIYWDSPLQTTAGTAEKMGNSIAYYYLPHRTVIFRTYNKNDIANAMKMSPRFAGIGAPIFDEYEPTEEFSNDPEELAPWQSDITENDYDGEIPEEGNKDDPNENPENEIPEEGPDKTDRGLKYDNQIDQNTYDMGQSPFVNYGVFTYEQLIGVSQVLWSRPNSFFEALAGEQKVNPMDYFISLRWYPLLKGIFSGLGSEQTKLYLGSGGQLDVVFDSVKESVVVISFGEIDLSSDEFNYYHNFLDYNPYTRIFVNLPYCGTKELNPGIVLDKKIELKAAFDFTDGSIIWQLWNKTDSQPILVEQGRIGCEVPISGVNAAQMSSNMVNATLSAFDLGIGLTKNIGQAIGTALMPGGSMAGLGRNILEEISSNTTNIISTAANVAMSSKEIVERSGGASGMAASGTQLTPCLIVQRPLATNPESYGNDTGYLYNKQKKIGNLEGFTITKNVDTSGIPNATATEKATIKRILDSGFYV